MLSTNEALTRVLALMTPVGGEDAPLAEAGGRVLKKPVIAERDQPPFAASAMDGYAVRTADCAAGAALSVVGEVPAGAMFSGVMGEAEAVRIFTGAPVPNGADAILIQENATRNGDRLIVDEAPSQGRFIRPAGLDFCAGDRISAPRRLTPADIALCAAMNAPVLHVARRPVVHLIATGDELVSPGGAPGPTQIISSNNYGVAAMLEAAGAKAVIQPIAPDRPEALIEALDRAADADLIVTLGGASVGDYDLVGQVFGAEGMDLSFYKVAMRPGKPMMAGRVRGTAMIGLPGNPVSSMVLAHLVLRPAVDAMLGLPAAAPARRLARLTGDIGRNGPREHFMRARVEDAGEGLSVTVFGNQDSSVLSLLSGANALAVQPPGDEGRKAGELVEVIML